MKVENTFSSRGLAFISMQKLHLPKSPTIQQYIHYHDLREYTLGDVHNYEFTVAPQSGGWVNFQEFTLK